IEELQAIAKQTFTETFGSQNTAEDLAKFLSEEYALDKLKAEVENPESFYYFCYFEDELAGYLKLNVGAAQTEPDYPEALEIQRIYVLQKYQGQKMGLSMMQHAIAVAKKIKKSQVWLGVWEKNLKAIAEDFGVNLICNAFSLVFLGTHKLKSLPIIADTLPFFPYFTLTF